MTNLLNWPDSSYSAIEPILDRYSGSNVLVTGGASFIGSHLVEALLAIGAKVRVIDDLSSGKLANLDLTNPGLNFVQADILGLDNLTQLFTDMDSVFHLAAIHGGRGYIETKQIDILRNLAIDNAVFNSSTNSNVRQIIYASSACAYPINLQAGSDWGQLLSEKQSGALGNGIPNPDGIYGWTKLIGEFQLESYVNLSSSRGRAVRIFTAYGERENESHAAIALMAKALLRIDPFPIWGDGGQTRNFTYVTDTVAGLLVAGMFKPSEPYAIFNTGTSTHNSILDFVNVVFKLLNWHPSEFDFQLRKPVGVASRASDNELIKKELAWEPEVSLEEGIARTLAWYIQKEDRPGSIQELELLLESR